MASSLILIIEDDPDLARLLAFDLEEGGFTVHRAPSAMLGLIAARELNPALVLLDLGLPDFDGAQVVARLRETGRVPIIVLSARDAVADKVRLLALGADDYLVKPFHEDELLARIRGQLRRHQLFTIVCGDLTLFPDQRWATFQGQDLHFSRKEFEILTLLARRAGQVVSRTELSEALWEGAIDERGSLIAVHLGNVRRKLRAVGAYGLLRSVRGGGYALWNGVSTERSASSHPRK